MSFYRKLKFFYMEENVDLIIDKNEQNSHESSNDMNEDPKNDLINDEDKIQQINISTNFPNSTEQNITSNNNENEQTSEPLYKNESLPVLNPNHSTNLIKNYTDPLFIQEPKSINENEIKEPSISNKDKPNPRNQIKREILSFTPSISSSPLSPTQQTIEKIVFEDETPQITNESIIEDNDDNKENQLNQEETPIIEEKSKEENLQPIQPIKQAQIKKPSIITNKPRKQFYPKPPNSARRPIRDPKIFNSLIGSSSTSLPASSRQQPKECPENIKQLKIKALKKEKLGKLSESDYMDLLFFLEVDHRKMIEKRNTKKILKYQNAIEYVRNYYNTMRKNEIFEGKVKALQEQRQNIEREIKAFDIKSELMEIELTKLQEEDRKQKKEKFKEEMQKVEEEWNSQGKLKNYNRPSNILLSMKAQRDNLVQQNRFNDAALLQTSIEQQQNQEVKMSYELFQRDYDEFTRKKKIKFDEDMEMFEDECQLETKKLKKDREKEKSILLVKLRKIEAEENFLMSDKNKTCNTGIRRKSRRTNITSKSLPPLSH